MIRRTVISKLSYVWHLRRSCGTCLWQAGQNAAAWNVIHRLRYAGHSTSQDSESEKQSNIYYYKGRLVCIRVSFTARYTVVNSGVVKYNTI